MALSFQTILVSIISSTSLVYIQFLLMRRMNDKSLVSAKALSLISLLFMIRMLFPFEFLYTITIPSKVIMPFLRDILLTEFPFFKINLMIVLCVILGIVSIYKLIRLIQDYQILNQLIKMSDGLNNDIPSLPIQYQKYPIKILPNIKTPCVVGVLNPTILLPNTLFTEKELEYIFRHEYLHISRLDLAFKALYELLLIIYWWNPVMYVFKNQFSRIIELRVDEEISNGLSEEEKIEYIQLMLKIQSVQNDAAKQSKFAVYFASTYDKPLYQRSSNILNKKKIQPKLSVMLMAFVFFFYMSTAIVIEPYYVKSSKRKEGFMINEGNAYFLLNEHNEYELYVNNQFLQIVTDVSHESFTNVPKFELEDGIIQEKN